MKTRIAVSLAAALAAISIEAAPIVVDAQARGEHLERKGRGYNDARVGIAVADKPAGPFKFVKSLWPNAGQWPADATDAESLLNLARLVRERGNAARADRLAKAADVFYHPEVLDPLKSRHDELNGKHANTLIPKVIGEMRRYELTGDAESRGLAEFFWETVIGHYLYAPGCVSTKEAFRGPDKQGANLTGFTGETCCTYNLLKLSRQLFEAEPRTAIADYQERALWNHILGQIEPSDGRVTYFLPMMTGSYKLQNRANDSFWCCQASAMESHVKVGRLIYSRCGDTLYVNQFIAGTYEDDDIALRLETDFPTHESARLVVTRGKGRVAVRRPFWATCEAASRYDVRELTAGDAVEIELPCRFRADVLRVGMSGRFSGARVVFAA